MNDKDKLNEEEIIEEHEIPKKQKNNKNKEEIKKLTSENNSLKRKIKSLEKDVKLYKEAYDKLHIVGKLQKELENMKIIADKNQAEFKKYAPQKFILDIIDPIEWFEKSISAKDVPDPVKNWLKGFEMIHQKLDESLANAGVSKIIPKKNEEHNPEESQVIETVDDENIKEGHVSEVMRPGYKLHDRVIRHAQVIVKKSNNKENEETINNKGDNNGI